MTGIRFKRGKPKPPRRLNASERTIWDAILNQIENPQELTEQDGYLLIQFIDCWLEREKYKGSPPKIQTERGWSTNHDHKAWQQAGNDMVAISKLFGFSPKHRKDLGCDEPSKQKSKIATRRNR